MKSALQIGAILAAVVAASLAFIFVFRNAEPLLYAAVACGALGIAAFAVALVRRSGGASAANFFKAAAVLAGTFFAVYATVVAAWILAGLGLFGFR